MGGQEEQLCASVLCNLDDPTRLTWRELKDGWGSVENFVRSYGLQPHKQEDLEEALSISRVLKQNGDRQNGDKQN